MKFREEILESGREASGGAEVDFVLPDPENLGTRGRLLVAAAEVFNRKNFHDTKLAEIADRAGLGKGTIYLHFEDKTDLFVSAFEYYEELFVRRAREKLTGITSPLMRLRLAIQLWLSTYIESRSGILSILNYSPSLSEEQRGRILAVRVLVREFYVEILEEIASRAPKANLKRSLDLLAGVLLDTMLGYLTRPDFEEFAVDNPPEKYAIFLVDVVMPYHDWMKGKL